jgi:hypothetical protein
VDARAVGYREGLVTESFVFARRVRSQLDAGKVGTELAFGNPPHRRGERAGPKTLPGGKLSGKPRAKLVGFAFVRASLGTSGGRSGLGSAMAA